jgi:hypothetical protein
MPVCPEVYPVSLLLRVRFVRRHWLRTTKVSDASLLDSPQREEVKSEGTFPNSAGVMAVSIALRDAIEAWEWCKLNRSHRMGRLTTDVVERDCQGCQVRY